MTASRKVVYAPRLTCVLCQVEQPTENFARMRRITKYRSPICQGCISRGGMPQVDPEEEPA